jgi:chromosome segregation ATPase
MEQILNQILSELKELKAGQARLEVGQANLEARQTNLEGAQNKLEVILNDVRFDVAELKTEVKQNSKDIQKIQTTIENEIKPDLKFVLQGLINTNEKLTSVEIKIDNLTERVDRHDIKIQVIEGGKSSKKRTQTKTSNT